MRCIRYEISGPCRLFLIMNTIIFDALILVKKTGHPFKLWNWGCKVFSHQQRELGHRRDLLGMTWKTGTWRTMRPWMLRSKNSTWSPWTGIDSRHSNQGYAMWQCMMKNATDHLSSNLLLGQSWCGMPMRSRRHCHRLHRGVQRFSSRVCRATSQSSIYGTCSSRLVPFFRFFSRLSRFKYIHGPKHVAFFRRFEFPETFPADLERDLLSFDSATKKMQQLAANISIRQNIRWDVASVHDGDCTCRRTGWNPQRRHFGRQSHSFCWESEEAMEQGPVRKVVLLFHQLILICSFPTSQTIARKIRWNRNGDHSQWPFNKREKSRSIWWVCWFHVSIRVCPFLKPLPEKGFAFVEFDSHQIAGRALARMRREDFSLEVCHLSWIIMHSKKSRAFLWTWAGPDRFGNQTRRQCHRF